MTTQGVLNRPDEVQASLVRAFAQGRVDGAGGPADVIDTHLNHVFLVADRAFKLKRAICLPFVDFRGLEQRRKACEAELAVNQSLGSPFYLSVTPVRRKGQDFALSGDGEIVDYAVVMTRFETSGRFDVLAAQGALSVETIEATASMIVQMHAKAPAGVQMGHAADYRQVIRTLRRTEGSAAAKLGLSLGDDGLYDRLDAELARVDPLIEDRRAAGKVRRLHGDLHLGNLCLFEGKPTAFDALEFDARMATTDVLYDLAFLLMDLVSRGLNRHANIAMNRYWDEAGESECGLALLPFFMSLRAAVRMAVAVEANALSEAVRLRTLAHHLLDRTSAVAMAIGGLSGTGKSALAREVAALLPGPAGARILRSDVLRKRAAGIELTAPAGAYHYDSSRRAEIYRSLVARAATASRAGASVIADATFQLANARQTLEIMLPQARKIWLDAPLDVRLQRIASRRRDASDADAVVATLQSSPGDLEKTWRRLDARRPIAELADCLLEEPQ